MPKNRIYIVLLLALLALYFSCASQKNKVINETAIETPPSKIVFLNYTISKDNNGNKHIQFINKIITDGKLKNNSDTYFKTGTVGDLKYSQLDKDSVAIKTIVIKNPYLKTIDSLQNSRPLITTKLN